MITGTIDKGQPRSETCGRYNYLLFLIKDSNQREITLCFWTQFSSVITTGFSLIEISAIVVTIWYFVNCWSDHYPTELLSANSGTVDRPASLHSRADPHATDGPVSCTWRGASPCRWRGPSPPSRCTRWAWRTTSPRTRSWPAPPPRPRGGWPPCWSGRCSPPTPGTGGRWGGASPSGPPHWSYGHGGGPGSEIWSQI